MSKDLTKEIRLAQNLSGEKVQLTKKGLSEIEDKLRNLIVNDRPVVAEELKEARAQGDLSENADYDAAKNKQAELEGEISDLENILSRVEIIADTKENIVKLGAVVDYVKGGKTFTVQIVGPVESDPNAETPKIGSDTPFAIATTGLQEGESVKVPAPKPYSVTIKKIK